MIQLRSADLQELAPEDVLLIDTSDNLVYKLVIQEERPLGLSVAEVSIDGPGGEETLGEFYCSTIRLGRPINFVGVPKAAEDNVITMGARMESKPVIKIELYESGKERA